MNYDEAIEYIHGTYKFGRKLGLENITKLLELLDNPQKDLKFIHVAGTNGKGSTCSFVNSILMEGGYKVGLYTSPYLETFTERIRVNMENIKEGKLANITAIVKEKSKAMVDLGYNHPTEFEIVTAIAMKYFYDENVDFVVLEVGMGGRFDATNIIENPILCIITPVSLDHTDYLGDTIAKIAFEKAGIIKNNSSVVLYPQEKSADDVIRCIAKEKNASIIDVDFDKKNILKQGINGQIFDYEDCDGNFENIEIALLGEHQVNNAIVAIGAIKHLNKMGYTNLTKNHIYKGLKNTIWPGRIELLKKDPLIIIDGAHNEDGANSLANAMDTYFNDEKKTLVIGMLKDKDIDAVLDILVPRFDKIITTTPSNDRAMDCEFLKSVVEKKYDKETLSIESIQDSVDFIMNNTCENEVVIFAGSLYMIGEVRSLIK